MGGGGLSLACWYHICIVPHSYLFYSAVSIASIFPPITLTLHLLSSCSVGWKSLDAVRMSHCSTWWFRLRFILWYYSLQIISDIHVYLTCALRVGFLTSFWWLSKVAYSLQIGPLFGAAMGQESLSLRYVSLIHYPHLLRSASIIRWSVDTCGSLMQTLQKSLHSFL